jgi:hypothetical protein
MEDQLISFETAKLAKEKGCYISGFPRMYNQDGKKWYQKRGKASLSYSVYLQGISLSTPLQYYYKYKNRIEELTIEIEELVQSNT